MIIWLFFGGVIIKHVLKGCAAHPCFIIPGEVKDWRTGESESFLSLKKVRSLFKSLSRGFSVDELLSQTHRLSLPACYVIPV